MNPFLARMRATVGDADPVARYLVEKIGHTALITLGLVTWFHVPLAWAALSAAVMYDLVGKVLWFSAHPTGPFWVEVRDTLFDLWVGLFVLAVVVWGALLVPPFLWAGGFLILDNNRWGKPS